MPRRVQGVEITPDARRAWGMYPDATGTIEEVLEHVLGLPEERKVALAMPGRVGLWRLWAAYQGGKVGLTMTKEDGRWRRLVSIMVTDADQ